MSRYLGPLRFSAPAFSKQSGRCCLGCLGYLALGCLLSLAVVICISMASDTFSLKILRYYPKKTASAIAGWLASCKLPPAVRGTVLGAFAGHYDINVKEAEKNLEAYESLQEFFTRRLKPDCRPQAKPAPGYLNSPVDGRIIASGRVDKGTVLQAKGLPYNVPELLKHLPALENFDGGHYITIYLSPKDYHRIHVPCEGLVKGLSRVEGELWPVNEASTRHIKRLYERNRRAAWFAKGTGQDEGLFVVAVLVGATHVGGVVIDPRWLEGRTLPEDGGFSVRSLPCKPGEDLGTFEFGSTVVLLVGGPKAKHWQLQAKDGPVRVGERLGAFQKKSE